MALEDGFCNLPHANYYKEGNTPYHPIFLIQGIDVPAMHLEFF